MEWSRVLSNKWFDQAYELILNACVSWYSELKRQLHQVFYQVNYKASPEPNGHRRFWKMLNTGFPFKLDVSRRCFPLNRLIFQVSLFSKHQTTAPQSIIIKYY